MSTVTTSGSASTVNDLMATMNPKKASASDDAEGVKADTDKFMTLLVTQLKNQDPMNPMDNAQVTSQLAQLKTVTGVNKLNETMNSLTASYQSAQSMQATSLIGRGVLVPGDNITLDSQGGDLGVQLGSDADSVKVDIFDAKGKKVETIDLGARKTGTVPLTWDGVPDSKKLDSNGKPVMLPMGNYSFTVTATKNGQPLKDAASLAYDHVQSVVTGGADGIKLNLLGKSTVKLDDIKQVM